MEWQKRVKKRLEGKRFRIKECRFNRYIIGASIEENQNDETGQI